MGAWNTGPFDNDDALDFVDETLAEGMMAAGGALQAAIELDDLEAPEASKAVAAAALVAACLTGSVEGLPSELHGLVDDRGRDDGLIPATRVALTKVQSSELNDLWADGPDHAEWLATLEAIRGKLP